MAAGADLVMPGPDLSPPAHRRPHRVEERVTVAAGVPTIWMGVLPELEGPRHVAACGPSRAAARPCRKALSEALPRADRPADPAGLGHDRDQPGRVGRPASSRTLADALTEDELADLRTHGRA